MTLYRSPADAINDALRPRRVLAAEHPVTDEDAPPGPTVTPAPLPAKRVTFPRTDPPPVTPWDGAWTTRSAHPNLVAEIWAAHDATVAAIPADTDEDDDGSELVAPWTHPEEVL